MNAQVKTFFLTIIAILAFAGNSLLTKLALTGPGISAAQFMVIRLVSGAMMLALLSWRNPGALLPRRADAAGIAALFIYAAGFTFAYVGLGAATGAMILFPTVQMTLAALAAAQGAPPTWREGIGLVVALAGLAWLLLPGLSAPPLLQASWMVAAGIGWGVYTLLGRGAGDPAARTARNFIGGAPLALIVLLAHPGKVPDLHGILLAVASGAITSGLGYTVWYAVLPRLNVAMAGAAQLLVPVVTAAVAITWLGEPLSFKLVAVAVLVLGGIWLAKGTPKKSAPKA
jgi:drug/metabolite transporter (DMT)-like permease